MSISRRMLLVPVAALVAVFALSCGGAKTTAKGTTPGTKYVTVKVGGTKAIPQIDPVEVNARDNGQPGGAGRIVWQADDTTKILHVEADDSKDTKPVKCLVAIKCSGASCAATANASYHGENGKDSATCKYRIWIDGMVKPTDPDVQVDNCCP